MDSLAMLRQLISNINLHVLWELYGVQSSSDPSSRANPERWCFINLDSDSNREDHYSTIQGVKTNKMKLGEAKCPPKRPRRENKSHEIAMEENIWKEFPEDLIEVVIARLPVATFFHFRSVCRKWSSLLSSHSFSEQCNAVQQPSPWFYTITHENTNSGAMYNPLLKKWHHPLLPSFPAKGIVLPVTSAGGLVCFLDIGHRNFFVCNPLTQAFKALPSRSVRDWSHLAVGMTVTVESAGSGYKIIWLEANGDHEVYDSVSNSWMCPGSLPSCIKLPLDLNFRSQTVSVGRMLYFMLTNPDGLITYNMEIHVWRQFSIPLPSHSNDHTLAECCGRIFLVGLLTKNAATCVCIWELQKMTLLWKEVDRMPNMMCLEFYGKQVRMTCLGNKGLLLLSLRSKQMNRLVLYDILSRKWDKVPGCMLPRGRKRQWIACGTSFVPCVTASA